MTPPGPKPVDVLALKALARIFTQLFLYLRDGRSGRIIRTGRIPTTRLQDGQVISLEEYRAQGALDEGEIVDSGGEVGVQIIGAKVPEGLSRGKQARLEAQTRKLLSEITADPGFKARRLWIDSPVFPRRDLWEQFIHASSEVEMQRVTADIARWMRRYVHVRWRRELQRHAGDLFHAKEHLWNYPRSDRPSSDNRRVEFFGKALAGLVLGIAPATATRQLSRWSSLKPPASQPPPIRAPGPNCPHCGVTEVEGFQPGTIVRCPECDQRYYIAQKDRKTQ